MKKNKQSAEMLKDDEIARFEGIEDGKKQIHKWTFRPITALTISWIQRNQIFSDTNDMIFKSAAYAFLHTAPYSEIRKVVNNRSAFIDAVDMWIEKNISHHDEISIIAQEMNEGFERYSSSVFVTKKEDEFGGESKSMGN